MKWIWQLICPCIVLFLFGACESDREKAVEVESTATGNMFHHQKDLRAGDSLHIRILSWGAEVTGSYLVLIADSLNQHYIGDSFFRQGTLADAWVDDLDKDGLPEVGVVLQEPNDMGYGRLYVHELSGDFTFQSVNFPPLPELLGADYGGRDSIYKRDDKMVVREFDLLDRLDTLSQSSRRRRILYVFENGLLEVSGSEELGIAGE